MARQLDERILRRANPANSLQVGSILAFPVDVTKPFLDLRVPADIDRIHCFVSWRKQFIGTVALPVIAGEVSGAVVQDAVADAYCWQIIGAFLGETITRDCASRYLTAERRYTEMDYTSPHGSRR